MNKEFKKKLKEDGFTHIYEWKDKPNNEYLPHQHKGKVSFYITEGFIGVNLNGKEMTIKSGERLDVPPATIHSVKVGPEGCTFVVGEEFEGDV